MIIMNNYQACLLHIEIFEMVVSRTSTNNHTSTNNQKPTTNRQCCLRFSKCCLRFSKCCLRFSKAAVKKWTHDSIELQPRCPIHGVGIANEYLKWWFREPKPPIEHQQPIKHQQPIEYQSPTGSAA